MNSTIAMMSTLLEYCQWADQMSRNSAEPSALICRGCSNRSR